MLAGRIYADVAAGQTGNVDLSLRKTSQIAAQMSNTEWIRSMPGSDADKKFLLNCVGCHTLERPVLSRYTADQFMPLLSRMAGYAQASTPLHPQLRVEKLPTEPGLEQRNRKQAEFLAKINLSAGEDWSYPLQGLARVSGRGTRVIITEYDLPRPTSQPHDVIVDQDLMGRMDAKTLEVKFYKLPTAVAGTRRGMMDDQERFWVGEFKGDKIGRLDTRTGDFKEWSMPTSWTNPYDVAVDKNGEAWTASMLSDRVVRLDPATGATTEYPLPNETNVRRVFVDNRTSPVSFWIGNKHGATVVKVEPLD